jgi:DNA-binding transcriptional regulator YdaS (Cro superfamily)
MNNKKSNYKQVAAINRAIEECGSMAALAKKLGVTKGLVWQWSHGLLPVPGHRCLAVEKACNAVVTRYELRPDIYVG